MTLRFVAAHGSSVDTANALVIYRPRMEPCAAPDEVEYQYAIYKNEDERDGLGFFGLSIVIEEGGEPVRVFTLDLGRPPVIESMIELKKRLKVDGDDFDFIQRLAEGLVGVFESRTDNTEAVRYVALTQDAPLHEKGIAVPDALPRLPNGQIVLAEARVEAHTIEGSVP